MSESRPLRIAVLGAGPIGIEAALYGAALGHDVLVIDQGAVGSAVSLWGHATMFSPWRMNVTPLGLRTLQAAGHQAPAPAHCPTGDEFVEKYLAPLGRSPLLDGRLRLHSRVVAVGRSGLLKSDLITPAARAEKRFRLLLEDSAGEHVEFADAVLDCTGTYLCPNAIGDGGIAAPGERWLGGRLIRHLPDVLFRDRKRFARRRTLLVGDGLSAATAATAFAQLCHEEPDTAVTWSLRTKNRPPYAPIENDALAGRVQLITAANRIAENPPAGLIFHPGTVVDGLFAEGHQLRVRWRPIDGPDATKEALFDEVIGLTGYGPERAIYEQLQVHEQLPARETLQHLEPGFFILGAKSFARNSAFLLQIGHAQVRAAYSLLHNNEGLDLYTAA